MFLTPRTALSHPYGQEFDVAYMSLLYEALMDSIGMKGTMKNLRNNYDLLSHIVKTNYHKNAKFRMLRNNFKEDLRILFAPILRDSWNKEGL